MSNKRPHIPESEETKHIRRIPSEISQNKWRQEGQESHTAFLFVQCLPSTTKARFKSMCAQTDRTSRPGEKRGESMRDALIKLMRLYVRFKGCPNEEDQAKMAEAIGLKFPTEADYKKIKVIDRKNNDPWDRY